MKLNISRLKRCLAALLAGSAACAWQSARGEEPVVLVLSNAGGAYEQVATAMRAELRSYPEVIELPLQDVDKLAGKRPRAVAAVGTKACERVAQAKLSAPLLCTLIPHAAFEAIAKGAGKPAHLSAVVLDQPLARQMALIRVLLPDARRIGVLFGPESAALQSAMAVAAGKQGMHLAGAQVDDSEVLYPALRAVLAADVLLAVPDGTVYNSATAQNLLRTAFEAHVPLIAFSPGYVRAGALAAVYSTPQQVGRQAGRSVGALLDGARAGPVQWPSEFEVSVNDPVARALGLDPEDPDKIKERLRTLEGSR